MKSFIAILVAAQLIIIFGFIYRSSKLRFQPSQWLHVFYVSLLTYATGTLLLYQLHLPFFYFANFMQLILAMILIRILKSYMQQYHYIKWSPVAWKVISYAAIIAWSAEFYFNDGMHNFLVYLPAMVANFFLIMWMSMASELMLPIRRNRMHNSRIAPKVFLLVYCLLQALLMGMHIAGSSAPEAFWTAGLMILSGSIAFIYGISFVVLKVGKWRRVSHPVKKVFLYSGQ